MFPLRNINPISIEEIPLNFNKTEKFESQIFCNYFPIIALVAVMKIALDFTISHILYFMFKPFLIQQIMVISVTFILLNNELYENINQT